LFDSNKIFIYGGTCVDVYNKTAIITIKETKRKIYFDFISYLFKALTIEYKMIETTGRKNIHRNSFSADIYQNKMYVVFPGNSMTNCAP